MSPNNSKVRVILAIMAFLGLSWGKKVYAPYYEKYLQRTRERLPLNTPVEELRFVVFDTETTGLNPVKDKLLSIGAVEVQGNDMVVGHTFDCLVRQKKEDTQQAEAIQVHGILPGEAEADLLEEKATQDFLAFVDNAILVAHHVKFDVLVIETALKKYGGDSLKNYKLDTVDLAKRAQPLGRGTTNAYNLDALGCQYNIPLHDRHTAAGDAYITGVLLLKLLARLRHRGVKTLRDLLR